MPHETLHEEPEGASSAALREQVLTAQWIQRRRQGGLNKDLNIQSMGEHCGLDASSRTLLNQAMEQLGLLAWAYHRVIRLARTIADLAQCEAIADAHVGEAIQFRCLDRRS